MVLNNFDITNFNSDIILDNCINLMNNLIIFIK